MPLQIPRVRFYSSTKAMARINSNSFGNFSSALFGFRIHVGFPSRPVLTVALSMLGAFGGVAQDTTKAAAAVPPPAVSVPGGLHSKPFEVELRSPVPSTDAAIRYTLDGSVPTERSASYTQPISITNSVYLRARTFVAGQGASHVVAHSYTFVADDFRRFESTLPILLINSFGRTIPHRTKVEASFRIVEPPAGGSIPVDATAAWEGRVEINQRGNTSRQFPKRSYTVKLIDQEARPAKVPLAGLPEDADWVLYAPYFDRTLLRDALIYDLSNRIGRYAPRTRYVEVFVAGSRGTVGSRDYVGVYVLEEKIKRGRHRVQFSDAPAGEEPQPSGPHYLFKMDHVDPDEKGFRTGRGLHFLYVQPKEREITGEQSQWLLNSLNQFERALYGRAFADPVEGYAKFLDVDAFIDHFWLVEMSKNVDGLRFSAFLQWRPGGKLKMGPIWDWDQSFGNANFYDGDSPEGWYWPNIRDTEINWFARLRKDPEFRRRYTARWLELRRGAFATAEIFRRMDALVASMGDARQRNSVRWPTRREYPAYVNQMKRWIQQRVDWIDQELASSAKASKPDADRGE